MKKNGIIVLLFLIIIGVLGYVFYQKKQREIVHEEATTILKSIEQVAKLVVVEGNISEVYSYNSSESVLFDLINLDKHAVLQIDAKVLVSYDLKKTKVDVDESTKTLYIKHIPEAEINIVPKYKYHNLSHDYFTELTASDINKIQAGAQKKLQEGIEKSNLKQEAKARFIESFSAIQKTTGTLGWKVVDETNTLSILKL